MHFSALKAASACRVPLLTEDWLKDLATPRFCSVASLVTTRQSSTLTSFGGTTDSRSRDHPFQAYTEAAEIPILRPTDGTG